ncbi:MAG: glycine zipper 2TM domain-containing protein [Proteobacteria bacterium]|nr:glycine zipper 2TM domain-containing protein [Pseudomonadota bacterium]
MKVKNLIVASALALSGVSFAPVSASAEGTHLSQCMHNALLGAGAGALAGALLSHHRLRGAALGAAVGGVGTYGVCRLLSHNDQRRVERNYDRALDGDRRVTDSWGGTGSNSKYLSVDRPTRVGDGCRRVTAHISDSQNGSQDLPPETYCRNSQGQWVPS